MLEENLRKRWRWLMLPMALASLVWAIVLLLNSLPALRQSLPKIQLIWLIFIFFGNIVSGYLAFEAFWLLFNKICFKKYKKISLAHIYFTGQLMKHLPGRIWGIIYQSQSTAGRHATFSQWISINIVFMVLNTAFALWVASIVIGFMLDGYLGVLAIIAGAAIFFFGWKETILVKIFNALYRLPIKSVSRLCDALQPFASVDIRFKLQVLFWFVISWLAYLSAWAGYGMAWPNLTAADGVWLCAIYTVAWFAGYISFITPSGLGVRELVFALLAQNFPPDAIAGMAVLGRVMLLLIDCIFGIVFISFGKTNE